MKNLEKFTSIVSVILAIAMVVVAIFSYKTAQTANQIAQTANQIAQNSYQIAQNSYEIAQNSYEIAHQANLPVISAITKRNYDKAEHLWTEELLVNNDGFPLSNFRCYAYLIMQIGLTGNETYVPLWGYFGTFANYTGNSRGLLVSMSEEGNQSMYESIRFDFWKEASKDGYEAPFWANTLLHVSYEDYTHTSWDKYFFVYSFGTSELSKDFIAGIIDCADANMDLMESEGLRCYLSALNGTELWHWYKGEYLG